MIHSGFDRKTVLHNFLFLSKSLYFRADWLDTSLSVRNHFQPAPCGFEGWGTSFPNMSPQRQDRQFANLTAAGSGSPINLPVVLTLHGKRIE